MSDPMYCPRCKSSNHGTVTFRFADGTVSCDNCLTQKENQHIIDQRRAANRKMWRDLARNAGKPVQESLD